MNEDDTEFLIGISNQLMATELIKRATVFMVGLSTMQINEVYELLESLEKKELVALVAALSLGVEVVHNPNAESK